MRTFASSENAQLALSQLTQLQTYFATGLSTLSTGSQFEAVTWLRDNGKHGGGERLQASNNDIFNRAQVNVSQIQYEGVDNKKIVSATALSTIVHPQHPQLPSIHIHVSWTELSNGKQYWRVMADLNPSINNATDTQSFLKELEHCSGDYYQDAIEQGERYFFIPALNTHRGTAHFYLEGFVEKSSEKGMAINIGQQAIDSYINLLSDKFTALPPPSDQELQQQLAYHTLYFYQVLTLDKGTTAGILIHSQNDVGTLGSLPAYIDRQLLIEWVSLTPSPSDKLVASIIDCLPDTQHVHIDNTIKQKLANTLRSHYQTYPIN